ncbi:unnamed protein product [Citrullus colocynthis]|uniref:Uncharacterized protein n=1 Tax=Citrullus colocynthis TaxID=252529 RepID=A0ABP0YJM7_9ROSI
MGHVWKMMQIRDELNVAVRGEERKNVRRREYVVEAQSGDNGKGPLKRLYLKELHRQPNPPSSHCLVNEESIQQSPAFLRPNLEIFSPNFHNLRILYMEEGVSVASFTFVSEAMERGKEESPQLSVSAAGQNCHRQ